MVLSSKEQTKKMVWFIVIYYEIAVIYRQPSDALHSYVCYTVFRCEIWSQMLFENSLPLPNFALRRLPTAQIVHEPGILSGISHFIPPSSSSFRFYENLIAVYSVAASSRSFHSITNLLWVYTSIYNKKILFSFYEWWWLWYNTMQYLIISFN